MVHYCFPYFPQFQILLLYFHLNVDFISGNSLFVIEKKLLRLTIKSTADFQAYT